MASLLAVLLVVFTLAATGGHAPFGGLKIAIFRDLHLLAPFRSAYQRFVEYVTLAMAPLAGIGADWMIRRTSRRPKLAMATTAAACLAVVAAVVVVPWPFWSGSLYDASNLIPAARINVPASYTTAAELVTLGGNDSSLLTLPIGSTPVVYLSWNDGLDGFSGIQPLSFMTGTATIDAAASGTYLHTALSDALASPSALCSGLDRLNIQYVAWERDADPTLMSVTQDYLGANMTTTSALLNSAPCLRILEKSSDIDVFENEAWTPALVSYARQPDGRDTRPADYTVGPGDNISVDPGPAGYHYVVLNEPFDNNWRLDGRPPIPGSNFNIFRVPDNQTLPFTLDNTATRKLRILLAIALLAIAATIAFAIPHTRNTLKLPLRSNDPGQQDPLASSDSLETQ
jgi:hypothetical protein